MKKPPASIRAWISNARLYFEAARRLPSPEMEAPRILLLLTAMENINIAESELDAWADGTLPDPRVYKSHKIKFEGVRKSITQLVFDANNKATEIDYVTSKQLDKLLQVARFGPKGKSPDLIAHFSKRWFTDDFERGLDNKIRWTENALNMYEDQINKGQLK